MLFLLASFIAITAALSFVFLKTNGLHEILTAVGWTSSTIPKTPSTPELASPRVDTDDEYGAPDLAHVDAAESQESEEESSAETVEDTSVTNVVYFREDVAGEPFDEPVIGTPMSEISADGGSGIASKKKFDKSTLLRARQHAVSQPAPEGLLILSQANQRGEIQAASGLSSFQNTANSPINGSAQLRMRRGRKESRSHRSSSTTSASSVLPGPYEPLRPSASRWCPKEAETAVESARKTVQSILNKLTPENFDRLSEQMSTQVDHRVPGTLDVVVSLILETALLHPLVADTYADLVVMLSKAWPRGLLHGGDGDDDDLKAAPLAPSARIIDSLASGALSTPLSPPSPQLEPADAICDFRSALLLSCQNNFTERTSEENPSDIQRKRLVHLVQFVGKLYCKRMLPEKIMHVCVKHLLECSEKTQSEQDVEALCSLLSTVGKELDKRDKPSMDAYFDRLDELTRALQAARLKFLIMDLLELRDNRWKPRRAAEGPRKLDEIRKEVERIAFKPPALKLAPSAIYRSKQASSPPVTRERASTTVSATALSKTPNGTAASPASSSNNSPTRARANTIGNVSSEFESPATLASSWDEDEFDRPAVIPSMSPMTSPPASPTHMSDRERVNRLVTMFFRTRSIEAVIDELTLAKGSGSELIYRGVLFSLDRTEPEQEEFHRLLAAIHWAGLCTVSDIQLAFIRAFEGIEDLTIDVPHCPEYAGKFLAHGVLDQIVTVPVASNVIQSVMNRSQDIAVRVTRRMVEIIKSRKGVTGLNTLLQSDKGLADIVSLHTSS